MKYTSEYLYDVPGSNYRDMGYVEALTYKIEKAKELLIRIRVASRKAMQRNDMQGIYIALKVRYKAVEEAIKWNQRALEEVS